MYKFGERSIKQYNTIHRDLQLILDEVIKVYDFSILEGLRSDERQYELFKEGRSKLDGINKRSKHQGRPDRDGNIVSFAVDIMPYKKGTNAFSGKTKDNARFYFLMGMVKITAKNLIKKGIITHDVRFGLDWDNDDIFTDQNFDDLPHFELTRLRRD